MNDYNERSSWLRKRPMLSINDPRWGRGEGNGDKSRKNDPKRPPPDGEGPPDLDEMWRNFNRRLAGLFGGKGGGGNRGFRPDNGRAARVGVGIVIGVLVAVYAGSGVFVVPDGQTGVVLQFGESRGTVGQGVHWRLPYPFESHEIVDTAQIHATEIGRNNVVRVANVKDASMLTRDGDIVDVRFVVQYRVRSATDYLFRTVDPELAVRQSAQAAIRRIVGAAAASDVTGADRDKLRDQLSAAIQGDLDHEQTGLVVTGVVIQAAQLPEQVQAAVDEIGKARQEREAAKNAAQAYADDLLPRARGDAAKLVDDAKAYADRVVTQAQGDADRYKQVYAQYEKAPAVVRERMYLDTMQDIYSKATKVYIGSKSGNSLVYLPIDKIVEQQRQRTAEAASGAASAAAGQPASAPDAGNAAPASSGATAASVSAAPAASAANAASAAPGNDPLRSREAFRSRSREDDLQ
ncbi:FtsH protease activity modulator HflK [Burkholderia gladioli]|uniref:FtsH protease activity modulator HflK n=1 Tax=Burkholderia gladioli TaxID=28095 RepID=UPI001364DFF9|nr:FtsH protease activity modulator HflK [Burkholderia gladioli]KAF1062076.1 Modulator of FtsH protease HflK [Burkholderia gladioli]WAG18416.1 FtsH protease activity modulator HflK [Burkholderia gladioli]